MGIANQVLWVVYAVALEQWGLIPGILLYTAVHVRNLWRWEKQE